MKKSRNRLGKRLPLLSVLTLIVGIVIIIKWVDTMSVNRIGPEVTHEEKERRTASLQHLDEVRTPLNSSALKETKLLPNQPLVPIERALGDSFNVIQVAPLHCFPDPLQTCPELYPLDENGDFNPEKLLASGPLYTISDPPVEERLAWLKKLSVLPTDIPSYQISHDRAIRYSRTMGTDIEALNLLMDGAALAIESLWAGNEYWLDDAMSDIFPQAQSREFLNTAPEEVLEAALVRIADIRASLPRPSDIARNTLRQYDSLPTSDIPLLNIPGFEPTDDSLAAWMYSQYIKQNAYKELNRRLDKLESLIPDYLAYLDNPFSREIPEELASLTQGTGLVYGDHYCWLANSNINAFELGVCLELYHRRHGEYPDDLSDLIPDYLLELPLSPILKRQYKYQKESEGYELGWLRSYTPRPENIVPYHYSRWFASLPKPFPEKEVSNRLEKIESVHHQEVLGIEAGPALPIPNATTMPLHFFGAGPFNSDEEPSVLPLLEAPPTLEAFEARVGAPAFIVPLSADSLLFHVGDRFNIPRGRAYYLRATIHSEQEIQIWLRASSTATMQIWCSRELPQVHYSSASVNIENPFGEFYKAELIRISFNTSPRIYPIILNPGDTPILIRILDYIGDPMFRFAIQGENGGLPEGVWFK